MNVNMMLNKPSFVLSRIAARINSDHLSFPWVAFFCFSKKPMTNQMCQSQIITAFSHGRRLAGKWSESFFSTSMTPMTPKPSPLLIQSQALATFPASETNIYIYIIYRYVIYVFFFHSAGGSRMLFLLED